MRIKEFRDGMSQKKIDEKYPWLNNAYIENAIIGERENRNVLIWYDGIWYDGIWYDGIWEDGIWEDGYWLDGVWRKGR